MKRAIGIAALLAAGGVAHAGHGHDDASANAPRPAWCAAYQQQKGFDEETASEGRGERAIDVYRYGSWYCQAPGNADVKKAFETVEANYRKKYGMTQAEVEAQLAIAVAAKDVDDEWTGGCRAYPRHDKPLGELTRHDADVWHQLLECDAALTQSRTDMQDPRTIWSLDRPGAQPSQLLLVHHLESSLYGHSAALDDAAYVVTALDAAKLDRAAYEAEVAKLGVKPVQRALLLHSFFKVQHGFEKVKAQLTDKAASDPLAKAILDVPAQAASDWQTIYDAHKDDLDAAFAVETKIADLVPNAKWDHTIGCDDVHKRFRAYAATAKPADADALEAFVHSDPTAYLLLEASAACDWGEERYLQAKVEGVVLHNNANVEFGGPRLYAASMAFHLALDAENEATKHSAHATFGAMSFVRRTPMDFLKDGAWNEDTKLSSPVYQSEYTQGAEGSGRGVVEGTIKAVKKTADGNVVSFKTEKWKEPTEKCTFSTRIIGWAASGQPVYDHTCVVVGYHDVTFTNDDILMTDDLSAELKPGQWIRVIDNMKSKAEKGAVILVGKRAGKETKWTAYLGVPLSGKAAAAAKPAKHH